MRLDPISLKLFITTCEAGTIASAAERAHIAPAAVSKRIAELETVLATRLLTRNNKGVEPTPAGVSLVKLARHALYELDDIVEQMRSFGAGVRGHVRIFANLSAITQFLPLELKQFRAEFPGIKIQLTEKTSLDVVRGVHDNAADLGFYSHASIPSGVDTFPYHHDRLALIVPEGHPLSVKEDVSFAQTLAYDFVGLHRDSAINRLLEDAAQASNKALKIAFQVTSFDALCMMVHAGHGIGVLPRGAIMAMHEKLALRVVALSDPWALRELRMCTKADEPMPIAARLLIERLGANRVETAQSVAPP